MQFIYQLLGLPEDQAKFLISEALAILIGIGFRRYCPPCSENIVKRHVSSVVFGLLLGFFCFGSTLIHMILVAYLSYILLIFSPRAYSHLVIFGFDMAYLSSIHLYYQIYYYGEKTFDVTSPLMVMIQKLTYLAFAFHDGGFKSDEDYQKLTPFQREHLLKELPSVLEFSSYTLNFQGIIVGPSCMFNDYIEFITGENVLKHTRKKGYTKVDYEAINIEKVIMAKTVKVLALIFIFLNVTVKFPLRYNIDPEMLSRPLWQRVVYFYISGNAGRMYFYIAWTLTDVVYNASGFGFNGFYDHDHDDEKKRGEAKWDLMNNINIWELEKSTNMKGITDAWNIQTSKWLRAVAYERLPRGKTLGAFLLSAFWHGFYPGYYITFVLCAGLVYVGRLVRRNIRPYFLKNRALFTFYDVLSWLCNHFCIYYVTAPFVFLDITTSAFFFGSWYWCVHIGMIVLGLLFSFKRPPSTKTVAKSS